MTDINYYDKSKSVNDKLSRLTYYFIDYITNHARVFENNSGNTYTLDEATNLAYAIANREEKCGDGTSYYDIFKAIMDKISPTYVLDSSKGVSLQKKINKLGDEIKEDEDKITEYEGKIDTLNKNNETLTDKLSEDASESGDEVTYRNIKNKIVKEIDNNNKQIEKLKEQVDNLNDEIKEKRIEINEKQEEYKNLVEQSGKQEYKDKVNQLMPQIESAYQAYTSAVAAKESKDRTKELLLAYQVLVGQYQRMVNEHVDEQGKSVSRKEIKEKGKEVADAKKAYEKNQEDVKKLQVTVDKKKNEWEELVAQLQALHEEKEEEETSTDVTLKAALSYFSNYKNCQEIDDDGNSPSLIDDVFVGSTSADCTKYDEGVNILECRGQELKFTYSGCNKEAGFVKAGVSHENRKDLSLDFWKLYDEQLTLKTVYDYCKMKLGDTIENYIDILTEILLEDTKNFYLPIKVCVSMISEMTISPTSFYDMRVFTSEEIEMFKSILNEVGYTNHYQYCNKTYWSTAEEKAKYDGFGQIVTKIQKTESEMEEIKGNSLDCAAKMQSYLEGILEEFYNTLDKAIRVEEENTSANNSSQIVASVEEEEIEETTPEVYSASYNELGRYETEAEYFQKLKSSDPIVFQKIVDKFKYFQPAFHSMSPEGFNARLTFLQQCMRQGHTLEEKAGNGMAATAGNLAFGRMPVCVLRIGDFINTRIIVKSMSIAYGSDGMSWDLNPEGIGVQPMFAKVSMAITLIGGQSLEGPISRLQNAVTFDYYANAGVYDNRADRVTIGKDEDGNYKTTYNYIFNPSENNEE